jgi:uncharacterized membrane protein
MNERGSTIPLLLGFFLIAALAVAGAIALGDAFVQQRDLQSVCDGAAAAVAASAADLDRAGSSDLGAKADSLRFADVRGAVAAYLARDPQRRAVYVTARLSPDHTRVTLVCEQTTSLTLGALFGRAHLRQRATSTARAAVLG